MVVLLVVAVAFSLLLVAVVLVVVEVGFSFSSACASHPPTFRAFAFAALSRIKAANFELSCCGHLSLPFVLKCLPLRPIKFEVPCRRPKGPRYSPFSSIVGSPTEMMDSMFGTFAKILVGLSCSIPQSDCRRAPPNHPRNLQKISNRGQVPNRSWSNSSMSAAQVFRVF